jgi:Ca2+:H+ antiporter
MPHNAPEEVVHEEKHLATARPEVNVWAALLVLAVTIAIMAFTAEMLVEAIEFTRESGSIREEWFGLILLPVVSFAADGTVATIFFARYALRLFLGKPEPPKQLAKGRAIDMSIQFVLFWLPFLVLLGWWTNHPLHMLFDLYEVSLLLGACFLVNAVTADAKTNWVEGLVLVGLYVMLATATWWYPGQESARWMLRCISVALKDDKQEEHTGGKEFGGVGEETEASNATEAAIRLGAKLAVRAARRAWDV